ncbi:hypothetical protein LPJ78_000039 [Coemansia sp. RSA 989]|nr:hypothetical protein BX667DRAFT_514879 [Coemansia mojavensis]KAJ1744421.1 hypothetical protein LPJ68_000101 [Coemansia sp. RSA 1086]KAJ1753653.1 hypothetical protein LPJ79_000246 [Coemansia sp. RSA 1821]KAJ1868527.1 hypothetical protein LPJ78_000039 [Coemansia sp. RSA 989]KAJ1876137.1 hypothetical protein LPJ55_000039 [Coemansia sp. RSA 990]KAJ2675879.1 hypothetical protein IWW42_000924 [Coemansia sp. RSA 1085]
MNRTAGTAITALSALLAEIEGQQLALISRLQLLRKQLATEANTEELLTTLSNYVNQANHLQRRMELIHSRVGDLKRRAERLKQHRATQSQEFAQKMRQERMRDVPTAPVVQHSPKPVDIVPLQRQQTASLPTSPAAERDASIFDSGRQSVMSLLSPLRISSSLGGAQSTSGSLNDADGSVQTQRPVSPAHSLSRSSTPQAARPASPAPSANSALEFTSASSPIATVKRKGKRRVRVPKIE